MTTLLRHRGSSGTANAAFRVLHTRWTDGRTEVLTGDKETDGFDVSMQDVMRLDNKARMNTPGKAAGNWAWRVGDSTVRVKLSSSPTQQYADLIHNPADHNVHLIDPGCGCCTLLQCC